MTTTEHEQESCIFAASGDAQSDVKCYAAFDRYVLHAAVALKNDKSAVGCLAEKAGVELPVAVLIILA